MRLVADYCSRAVVMKDGGILLDGPPASVFRSRDILEKASLRPPQITQLAQSLTDIGFSEEILKVDEFLAQTEVMRYAKAI
jgi:energy-coupling factor transport system ATP-binding protein